MPDLALYNVEDLTASVTHTGNFAQGDVGDTYTITVSNIGQYATEGTVSLAETLPAGLTATGFTGEGWTVDLATLTATRIDALGPSASYPSLTLTVDVSTNAPSSVTNLVTVSGGNEYNTGNDTGTDVTAITPGATAKVRRGGTGNDWSTGANWVGGVAPVTGDRLFFAGTTYTTSVNDYTGAVFDSITFENGGFTVSGNFIVLDPQHGVAIDSSGGENTVSLSVTLDKAATLLIESDGGLSFAAGATIDNGGYLLSVTSGNEDATASEWLGAVAGAGGLTKTGTGAVTLAGVSDYGGADGRRGRHARPGRRR